MAKEINSVVAGAIVIAALRLTQKMHYDITVHSKKTLQQAKLKILSTTRRREAS
jgi:hypothetical protein